MQVSPIFDSVWKTMRRCPSGPVGFALAAALIVVITYQLVSKPATAQGITYALSSKAAKSTTPHTPHSTYQSCVTKPAGLVAWWPGDGNANDIAGSNHGTLQNGSDFASGLVGPSFSFDGVDDYVNVPDSQSLDSISNAISVEGWINPQQPLSPPFPGLGLSVGTIFARRDPGISEGFRVDLLADGRIGLVVRTTTSPTVQGSIFTTANSVIQFNGQWKHFVATADSTTGQVKLYVNGQNVALTTTFGPPTISGQLFNVNKLFIGRRSPIEEEGTALAAHYRGLIDEVSLYSRALALSEITSIFNAGTAGKCKTQICTLACNAIVPATATTGAQADFKATAVTSNCTGSPTYEWNFGDSTTNSTLPNPKHPYAQAGSYNWTLTVRLTGAGTCTKTGTITITPNCIVPTITAQPSSRIIASGQTATLNVIASGTAPLTYQWYEGIRGNTSKPLTGATGNSFTTPSLTNTTSYWVRVSNACGNVDSNAAIATVNGTGKLGVQVTDPACNEPLLCQGAYLKETLRGDVFVDTDINRLASTNVFRSAVVADGVTLLLLRVRSESPVTFKLTDSPGTGVLLTRQGVLKGAEVVAEAESTAIGKIAFAVYRAPLDYTEATPQAKITAISAAGNGSLNLELRRPPVVLVHGVWSGKSAWQGLAQRLKERGFDVVYEYLPDYGAIQPAGSFDPIPPSQTDRLAINSLIGSTRLLLSEIRRTRNAAVTQVDVFGHSMGGMVARARVAATFNPYRRLANYKSGDFHKIITVGTPHRGSPLADWLVAHKCDIVVDETIRKTRYRYSLEQVMAYLNYPIGPAIFGFQTNGTAIKNIGATNVPSHAIVGTAPTSSSSEDNLNKIFSWIGSSDTVDCLLSGGGQCDKHHDTIVPVESQRGGLTGGLVTEMDWQVVHADLEVDQFFGFEPDVLNETASPDVWKRVEELLKAAIVPATFGSFPALNPPPSPTPRPQYTCSPPQLASLEYEANLATAASVTLTPAPNTIVRPGDVIQITLTVTGGNPVGGALFGIDRRFLRIDGVGPFSFSYPVPSNRVGKVTITADTFGPGPENYSADTLLVVTPNAALTSLITNPNNLLLEQVGERLPLQVTGLFANGTQFDLTSSTAGTTYAVQGGASNVITISSEGVIEARGNGQATAIITNAGKTATVKVYVSSTGVPNSVVVNVSAANYTNVVFAPEEIVSVFGTSLATATQAATTMPLPTSLAGTTVKVTDSTGTERLAPLFFVSPNQINYQIPPGTAPGAAMVRIDRPNDFPALETLLIDATAPGLFTANASGNGVAAALALRVKSSGVQSFEPIARFDTTISRMVATPIDLGPASEQVFLILYGTGLKFRSSLAAVSAKLGGVDAPVSFAQAQGSLTGLDQVNALIPRSLLGRGEVDVVLTVDGKVANTVRVAIK